MTDLSPADKAALDSALRTARSRHAKADSDTKKQEAKRHEYPERLKASLERDSVLFKGVREQRIQKAMDAWSKKVNATFAGATSDYPAAKNRLGRLLNQEGLHATSMAFIGSSLGSGKTWQAYGYLNDAIRLGALVPAQIILGTETDIISRVSGGGFEKLKNLDALLSPTVKTYFVDDVGTGYFYREDQRHEVWFNLIDHIYAKQLTLIVTSNLEFSRQGLGNWIGPRAFDRLASLVGEDGVIVMRGANKRAEVLEKNEEKLKGGKTPPRRS